jgi:hypothetical protein
MTLHEGARVLLRATDGRVLDEGDVRALSPDGRRVLVRWSRAGGLRATTCGVPVQGLEVWRIRKK